MRLKPIRLITAFFLLATPPAMAESVDAIRVGAHDDVTRIVVDVGEKTDFRAFMLPDPPRVAIDLPTYDWRAKPVRPAKGGLVTAVRQGSLSPTVSRIVVDLSGRAAIKNAYRMPALDGDGMRLIVDLTRGDGDKKVFGTLTAEPGDTPQPATRPGASKAAAPTIFGRGPHQTSAKDTAGAPMGETAGPRQAEPDAPAAETPPNLVTPKVRDLPDDGGHANAAKPLIVIDPGHGGVDPGSLGVGGIFEKNVTIGMARELKRELEATGRYRVLMTRDDDTFIPLGQRVAFARAHHANLFVSLHADSIAKPGIQGASIYTLSDKASDEQSAKLAARENRADAIGGLNVDTADDQVASILVDLVMRDTMNQSKFFANNVVDEMRGDGITLLEHTQRSAGFAVLKAPDIPSVLIEMGFMTNAKESALLMSDNYRRKVASALVQGVGNYFRTIAKTARP